MRANSPSAYFASLLLHAAVAAIVAGLSLYIAQVQSQQRPPVIFDLVAGPPTAPGELVAPKLGNTLTAPKITPPVNAPIRQPEVAPQPEPVVETVKTPPPEDVVPTPPKETPKPKAKDVPKPKQTLTKEAKKVVDQMNNRRIVSYLNEKKKIDREIAKQEAARKAAEARAAKANAGVKGVDVKGIKDGVLQGSDTNTNGGGRGKALSREEADELLVYQTLLKNELKPIFDELKPTGVSDLLTADISFLMTANGEIGNVRVARSSGSAEFDQAAVASFKRLAWGKRRPDGKTSTWVLTFRMRDLD